MAEAKAPGGGATRGRGWFSGGEKKLFFDLQKTAVRKSVVCPVEFSPPPKARVSVFNLDSLISLSVNLQFSEKTRLRNNTVDLTALLLNKLPILTPKLITHGES